MRARLLILAALAGCGRDLTLPEPPQDDTVPPLPVINLGVEVAAAQGVLNVLWQLEPSELDPATSHTAGLAVLRWEGDTPKQAPEDGAPVAEGRLVGTGLVVFVTDDPQLTFFDDASARRGREYTYGVVAHNSAYRWGPVRTAKGTLPPLAPLTASVEEDPGGGVVVSWILPSEGVELSALVLRSAGVAPDALPPARELEAGDPVGNAAVVFAGQEHELHDADVVAGVEYHYAIHAVGDGFVASPPEKVAFTLAPPSFTTAAVFPRTASAGMRVQIDFTLARTVPLEATPVVTVAGRPATAEPGPDVSHPSHRYVYDVTGDEAEGTAEVSITAVDFSGEGTRTVPLVLDFTPPEIEAWDVTGGPFSAGEEVRLEVTASEPLGSLLGSVRGAPMACAATPGSVRWICRYRVNGSEPAGAQSVSLAFTDRAGNGATALAADAFVKG